MADITRVVDRVFARLMAMYGSTTLVSKFDGLNIDEVKAVWAKPLAHYTPHQIGYALDSLRTSNFPPSLPEFLGFCDIGRQVIPAPTLRLEQKAYNPDDPECAESRDRNREVREKLLQPGNRDWAYLIQARHDIGGKIEPVALALAQEAINTDPDRYRRKEAA